MPGHVRYTELTRRAAFELADQGLGATEIALRLREGRGGVPAIEIPRRTVGHWLAQHRRQPKLPEGTVPVPFSLGPEAVLERMTELGCGPGVPWDKKLSPEPVVVDDDGDPIWPGTSPGMLQRPLVEGSWVEDLRDEGLSREEVVDRTGFSPDDVCWIFEPSEKELPPGPERGAAYRDEWLPERERLSELFQQGDDGRWHRREPVAVPA